MRAAKAKYGKFAYSSAFAYSVPTGGYSLEAMGADNALALSDDFEAGGFGETWRTRRVPVDARIEIVNLTPVLVSGWNPWPDVSVETWLIPPAEETPNWHVRVHRIRTGRRLRSAEGAWALYGCRRQDGRELDVLTEESSKDVNAEGRSAPGPRAAFAKSVDGIVGVAELGGQEAREGRVLDADANTNLLHARTVLPTLLGNLTEGDERWYVTGVFAMPECLEGWEAWWRKGWERRPEVPVWVDRMIAGLS